MTNAELLRAISNEIDLKQATIYDTEAARLLSLVDWREMASVMEITEAMIEALDALIPLADTRYADPVELRKFRGVLRIAKNYRPSAPLGAGDDVQAAHDLRERSQR